MKSKKRRVRNHRYTGRAALKPLTLKESPDDNPDPDDGPARELCDALASGPVALGDLRRQSNLGPELIGRLETKYSGIFKCVEQFGVPCVKLLNDPVSSMLMIGRRSPQGKAVLSPMDNDPEQAGSQSNALEASKDRLVKLLEFARFSPWLEESGFGMDLIGRINTTYPGLLLVEPNELGQKYVFRISLVGSEKVEREFPAPRSHRTAQPPAPVVSSMSDEDRHALTWKPASRGSASRREHRPSFGAGRARNPLVNL